MMMWGWGDGWGAAGEALMVIVMLAALALIVVGFLLLVRGLSGQGHNGPTAPPGPVGPVGPPTMSSALQILEERYARGEIERDDYLRRKQDLLGAGGST
jgi:putative membrane protein